MAMKTLIPPHYRALVSSIASFKSHSAILQFPNTWEARIFYNRSVLLCILAVWGKMEGWRKVKLSLQLKIMEENSKVRPKKIV